MRNMEKRIRILESHRTNVATVLIAVSPGETHDEAVARSGHNKANLREHQLVFVHTGVPRAM